jgi:acetyl esterase/lipase
MTGMPAEDIHPELRRLARVLPRQLVYRWSIPLLRRLSLRRPNNGAGVERHSLPGGPGVRLYRPARVTGDVPALLWIHGGGYVVGSADDDDDLCRALTRKLGVVVAAVDYRLAPEHPYPAGLEDCYRALRWLAGLAGVDPGRVAIGGASAGGGLAASLAFLARDRGEVRLVAQVLSYPMLDDRTVDSSLEDKGFRVWNTASNRVGWSCYLGDADRSVAVPARRDDLAGLPPAWIGVGTLDLFHTEDLRYARRLTDAGVPCEVHEAPGAFHGFDRVAPKSSVSRAYLDSMCASLRRAMTMVG